MRRKILNQIKARRALRKKLAKIQRRNTYSKNIHFDFKMKNTIKLDNPCAICGIREATTKDHVPPKAIFPKPRPDLITVPACAQCNNGASDYDDLFKVYLSMQAAGKNDLAAKLFHDKTVRTLKRNNTLLSKIGQESKEIKLRNKKGALETETGILWDSKAHDAVIERTIRGLYFHHTGIVVPKDTTLKVQWLYGVPEEILSKLDLFTEIVIGDDQVIYKYLIFNDDPRYSLWLFDFYGAHWASGHISPLTKKYK